VNYVVVNYVLNYRRRDVIKMVDLRAARPRRAGRLGQVLAIRLTSSGPCRHRQVAAMAAILQQSAPSGLG